MPRGCKCARYLLYLLCSVRRDWRDAGAWLVTKRCACVGGAGPIPPSLSPVVPPSTCNLAMVMSGLHWRRVALSESECGPAHATDYWGSVLVSQLYLFSLLVCLLREMDRRLPLNTTRAGRTICCLRCRPRLFRSFFSPSRAWVKFTKLALQRAPTDAGRTRLSSKAWRPHRREMLAGAGRTLRVE